MAKFKFKYGVMNSGKTQELLRIWYSYTKGVELEKALVLCPEKDDRYRVGTVTSRTGQSIEATTVDDSWYITMLVQIYTEELALPENERSYDIPEVVLVDEIQFFDEGSVYELKGFVDLGIPVIAFGLLKDFQNNLFEGTQAAIAVAEEMQEIETICDFCNKKAIMNLRVGDSKEQIVVGGNEMYHPVCHNHYRTKGK